MNTVCGISTVPARFELFKLLRVIGEGTAQTIVPIAAALPAEAAGLVSVTITTADESFHPFTGKIVKQGTLVITAILSTTAGALTTFTTTAPFIATLEIPGITPRSDLDIQFQNVLIENDLRIVDGTLTGKIHLVEFVKVSEFVQRFLWTTRSPSVVHPHTTCVCR